MLKKLFLAVLCALLPLIVSAQDFSGLARASAQGSMITNNQVTLSLSQGVPFRIFTLADPMRMVVDFAEVDFADVLAKKNATVSLRQIIRELEAAQASVWSPVILNGSGFGLWANHSLVMASYISRANAALIDLRELLAQG